MKKSVKRISFLLVLSLVMSLFASLTAFAVVTEKRIDLKNGNYVTFTNFVEETTTEDVGYGSKQYIAKGPVTVTFNGKLSEDASIAQWFDDDIEGLNYIEIKDNKAVITETEGVSYGIFPVFEGETDRFGNAILLKVIAGDTTPAITTTPQPAALAATPTDSKVEVNGKNVSFEAYTINGFNYFKLRDLAMAINGSEKNFEVSFDEAKNAIALTSKKAYTPAGGELTVSDKSNLQVSETSATILLDGKEVQVTAYSINGSNYFQLRDIGRMMNFGVAWDGEASIIKIDTKAEYKE
ncbi:hypothetical protein NV379_12315 [Paenibacillus sp. N1-5-1-14]|uniref:hypothetical protein n=1 Tax=Paenibacillus radicibacter TaxID=2972488 RepID=UPI002158C4FA|nr:hypothetical protein [Paenibacillus radicibacter]MCR8643436.1 hypothetical protein [Paenibacillus radicibacter]